MGFIATPRRRWCCSCMPSRCRSSASPRRAMAAASPRPPSAGASSDLFRSRCRSGTSRSRSAQVDAARFPLHAITQRPMFMYHAWGSQNAWLRQIAARNFLYLHPDTAAKHGVADGDWVEVRSHLGAIEVQVRLAANVQPDTVWTWNAIGKRRGAWRLDKDAPEGRKGFLLNHLIGDRTPDGDYANADPVTGQAAWFDLRVAMRRPRAARGQRTAVRAAGAGRGADARRCATARSGGALMGVEALLTLAVLAGAVACSSPRSCRSTWWRCWCWPACWCSGWCRRPRRCRASPARRRSPWRRCSCSAPGWRAAARCNAVGRWFARIRTGWVFTLAVMLTLGGDVGLRQQHRGVGGVPAGGAGGGGGQQVLGVEGADPDELRRADGRRVHPDRHLDQPAGARAGAGHGAARLQPVRVRPARA
jgi:hypothetical protein